MISNPTIRWENIFFQESHHNDECTGDEIILLGGNQTGGDENTYGKVCYSAAKKSEIIGYWFPSDYKIIKEDYKLKEININAKSDNSSTTR